MSPLSQDTSALSQQVTQTLEEYFTTLEEQSPTQVHELVMAQVEKPMLVFVLQKTQYNQSKAAQILGINRNTLRKKIQKYQIKETLVSDECKLTRD